MLPVSVMKSQVSHLIQKGDSTYISKIVEWLDQRYDDVLRRAQWPQLKRTTTVNSVSGVATIVLPKDIEFIYEIQDRVNDRSLQVLDPSSVSRNMVDIVDVQDIPHGYWLEEDTVAAQPTAASALSLVSSAGADTTQRVRIWGRNSAGENLSELLTLTGTTPVASSNSYLYVDRVSKDGNTTGVITITSNSGAVTIATMAPNEYTSRYTRIHLIRIPNAVITYNMTYRYRPPRLVNDEDVPVLPCHQALIQGAYAQALEEQRQFSKAQLTWQRYQDMVGALIVEFMQHAEGVTLFTPQITKDRLDRPVY